MKSWRELSRLPESPDYWEGVTGRVRQSLRDVPAEPVNAQRSLVPFAWMAIAATLIAVLATRTTPPDAGAPVSLLNGIVPADSLGVTWIEQSRPPSVAEMLVARMGGGQ